MMGIEINPSDEQIDEVCGSARADRWKGDGRQYDRDTVRLALKHLVPPVMFANLVEETTRDLRRMLFPDEPDRPRSLADIAKAAESRLKDLGWFGHGEWIKADDVHQSARAIDVAMNGEEGAAKQPCLSDVVDQAVKILETARRATSSVSSHKMSKAEAELTRRGHNRFSTETELRTILQEVVDEAASMVSTKTLRRAVKALEEKPDGC